MNSDEKAFHRFDSAEAQPAVKGSHKADGGPVAAKEKKDQRTWDLEEGVHRGFDAPLRLAHLEKASVQLRMKKS